MTRHATPRIEHPHPRHVPPVCATCRCEMSELVGLRTVHFGNGLIRIGRLYRCPSCEAQSITNFGEDFFRVNAGDRADVNLRNTTPAPVPLVSTGQGDSQVGTMPEDL